MSREMKLPNEKTKRHKMRYVLGAFTLPVVALGATAAQDFGQGLADLASGDSFGQRPAYGERLAQRHAVSNAFLARAS